jgi:tRNA A22 N-methylase
LKKKRGKKKIQGNKDKNKENHKNRLSVGDKCWKSKKQYLEKKTKKILQKIKTRRKLCKMIKKIKCEEKKNKKNHFLKKIIILSLSY